MPEPDRSGPAAPGSVGIVRTQAFSFGKPPDEMPLESGKKLGPITLAYETYGRLTPAKDNAIMVLSALSGDAHAAGLHAAHDAKPGWWDNMIGPGKPLDTDRYFVICSNLIGGCMGSTGPSSVNPATGKPYGLSFPVLTIRDMVDAECRLLDHLGIPALLAVIGGSIGGMQALQWAISYPDRVRLSIPIAASCRPSAQAIAFNAVGRHAIMSDPDWRGGDYYGKKPPSGGLSLARMVGHITYLSEASMHQKFGRRLQEKEAYGYDFTTEFEVESYLHHKGDHFVKRFDANSYLFITKAMDYFDLGRAHGTLRKALAGVASKFLVLSFTSDWLFPSVQSKEIVTALRQNRVDVVYQEIESDHGHDSFLVQTGDMGRLVSSFLAQGMRRGGAR